MAPPIFMRPISTNALFLPTVAIAPLSLYLKGLNGWFLHILLTKFLPKSLPCCIAAGATCGWPLGKSLVAIQATSPTAKTSFIPIT